MSSFDRFARDLTDTIRIFGVAMRAFTGLDPAVPTPRLVLPDWIANALRGAAEVVGPRGVAPTIYG